jgi:hypothetical protein
MFVHVPVTVAVAVAVTVIVAMTVTVTEGFGDEGTNPRPSTTWMPRMLNVTVGQSLRRPWKLATM